MLTTLHVKIYSYTCIDVRLTTPKRLDGFGSCSVYCVIYRCPVNVNVPLNIPASKIGTHKTKWRFCQQIVSWFWLNFMKLHWGKQRYAGAKRRNYDFVEIGFTGRTDVTGCRHLAIEPCTDQQLISFTRQCNANRIRGIMYIVRSNVLPTVNIKTNVVWNVKPCSGRENKDVSEKFSSTFRVKAQLCMQAVFFIWW
jgi:hypothetical protein